MVSGKSSSWAREASLEVVSNDLSSVSYWLGHANLNSTRLYVEIDMEAKRRTLDKTHAPDPVKPRPGHRPDLLDWLKELSTGRPVM